MIEEKKQYQITNEIKQVNAIWYEKHYFWLDTKFVHVQPSALSKKAILLYLLYARSCNPRHMQCSFVSYTTARRSLGLSSATVDKARQELLDGGFVKLRPDLKTGPFKTIAVEVLDFPSFDGGSSTVSQQPRSLLKTKSVFFMRSKLVDEGILRELTLLELRTLLLLYSICRWQECLGIDFQLLHRWNPDFPKGVYAIKKTFDSGVHPSIIGKQCFGVAQHKEWQVSDELLSNYGQGIYKALKSLVENVLFDFAPVIIWRDNDDPDITEVRQEIFKGIVKFHSKTDKYKQKYRLAPLNDNESVVWILRPVYPAKNSDYYSYTKKRTEQRQQAIQLYINQYQGEQD